MVEVKRILCPVDFSESARYALEYGLMLARRLGAELTVLHVTEITPLIQTYDGAPDIDLRATMERSAREQMAQLLAAMDVTGVRVTSDIVRGPTHHTIIEYAAESKTDLIVMGTHGRSRLERTFFGSVTERVMKSVTCAVLVVRKPKGGESAARKKKKKTGSAR